MTSKLILDRSAAQGEGSRVSAFARIERETAPTNTDPRVMAMLRARPANPPRPVERYLRVARGRES